MSNFETTYDSGHRGTTTAIVSAPPQHEPMGVFDEWLDNDDVDYSLLKKLTTFNVKDKADCTTFWRP